MLGSRQRPHIVLDNRWQTGAFAHHSDQWKIRPVQNGDTWTTSERGETGPARLTPTAQIDGSVLTCWDTTSAIVAVTDSGSVAASQTVR